MQALMACPCLELSAPKADALLPWVLQVWSPRGRSVPMVNWGSHVFPPGFPSQATTASTQPVRKVLFRCFNPAVRSPCSLVRVTLAVLGPQPWPCPRAAPWTMQCGQENQGSLVLCMCGRLRTSELFSLAAPISPSPHLIDAGADL